MSKAIKYKVWQNDELEYIIKVKETSKGIHYEMYRSDNSCWSSHVRGELIEHWIDTGNHLEGLDVNDKCTDYEKLGQIKIMLDFIHKYDKNLFVKYKIKMK